VRTENRTTVTPLSPPGILLSATSDFACRYAPTRILSLFTALLPLHSPGSGRPSSASRGSRIRHGRRVHSRRRVEVEIDERASCRGSAAG